jgi:benzoate-CoA ligase
MSDVSGRSRNFAAHLLLDRAALWPDRIAARCEGRGMTYAELSRKSFAMAALLRSRGLGPGSRALLVLPDSFSFQVAFLGCLLAGIVAAPVNSRLRREDYAGCIADCAPGLVLAPAGHEALDAAGDAGVPWLALDDKALAGLLAGLAPAAPHPSREEDVCVLFVTSGTTGHPKIVPHRHADFFTVAESSGGFLQYRAGDVALCSAKMGHAYGLFASLTLPFMVGATAVLDPEKPSPENTLRLIALERVSIFCSVPALFALLLLSDLPREAFGGLRTCFSAGEVLPAAVSGAWLEKTGHVIWQGYGSTEVMTFVIGGIPPDLAPGTAGRALKPFEARILAPDGVPLPDGEPGHLALRGPTTMAGYLNDPEWTARVFTPDGWLLTGDMASRRDGVYTILGRMDDMFKAGGLWVSPARVENAVQSHPAVAQCAVTAGSAGAFSLVRAHVTLVPGVAPGPDLAGQLRLHAAKTLPDFMVPADVLFHSSLPMTATGKVQRYKLRTQAS